MARWGPRNKYQTSGGICSVVVLSIHIWPEPRPGEENQGDADGILLGLAIPGDYVGRIKSYRGPYRVSNISRSQTTELVCRSGSQWPA